MSIGTFDCPICGFDKPHVHGAPIVAQRYTLNDAQRRGLRVEAEQAYRFDELRAECERDPRAYVNKYGSVNTVESGPLVRWLLDIIDRLKATQVGSPGRGEAK